MPSCRHRKWTLSGDGLDLEDRNCVPGPGS